ncbi:MULTISPECIES: antibiotic biosynthesis monooxygenase family protein [unclassified Sphingomonas]|uniref:antibiotic biosynthesis monooxygenase family protein n=1 Tax=unclassified Sphingomonas TaxID=196159 RepID=UPI0008344981|nr:MULTISPECIES: antibiotic biosynthesis monooxygenase [unclassified Sphingomonas]
MRNRRRGEIAVIFQSRRRPGDDAAYAAAAHAMEALAREQPGYRGHEHARGDDGFGITISYWADEASAIAWRDHPEHRRIRDLGRAHWYADHETIVTRVERDYRWQAE